MPGPDELDYFLSQDPVVSCPREDPELIHMHRASLWADDARPLCVLAYDHRSQFEELAAKNDRPIADISRFKLLLTEALCEMVAHGSDAVRYGAIIDHRFGGAALDRIAGQSLWTASPIERPGSRPLEFDPSLAPGRRITEWPSNRIVKCLAFYHPDDPDELRQAQDEALQQLYAELVALERRIVLEIICPDIGASALRDPLPRALSRLYDLGIKPDWWKLPSQSPDGWQKVSDVIRERDPYCKGVVVLGLGANLEPLLENLRISAGFNICRGFAVGRSIFADAAAEWFSGSLDDAGTKAIVTARYQRMIDAWVSGIKSGADNETPTVSIGSSGPN
jgi:5-dehydro-2-deoxygluconokinase